MLFYLPKADGVSDRYFVYYHLPKTKFVNKKQPDQLFN